MLYSVVMISGGVDIIIVIYRFCWKKLSVLVMFVFL